MQSTFRIASAQKSVPRDGTEEEPVGLCLLFEAVIYVSVHGFFAISYMECSCITTVVTYKHLKM